jgi:MerR family regulatory protein
MRHHPAGNPPGGALGATELADDGRDHGALHCHGPQSTPSSTLEVKMSDRLLTIGELARRAGVATSALRYYEELGLLPAPTRVSGQRRYPESAVGLVGIILLLREVGFSLASPVNRSTKPTRTSDCTPRAPIAWER